MFFQVKPQFVGVLTESPLPFLHKETRTKERYYLDRDSKRKNANVPDAVPIVQAPSLSLFSPSTIGPVKQCISNIPKEQKARNATSAFSGSCIQKHTKTYRYSTEEGKG